MINEILSILGGIFIMIFALVICNKFAKENDELKREIKRMEGYKRIRKNFIDSLTNDKKLLKDLLKNNSKDLKIMESKLDMSQEDVKNLQEIMVFDNAVLTEKTEIIEFMENKIFELDDKNCELKVENCELEENNSFYQEKNCARFQEINYLRKKINAIRSKRLLKVVKGERLGMSKW